MAARKQIQIAERENEILRIAGEILASEGPNALTMERVLARVQFSKGTLYNHFTCREDLLVAFHAQCFAEHLAFFERGALFRGRARERFTAAGVSHEVKHLLDTCALRFSLTEEMLAAASERWREAFLSTHRETIGVFIGIVRDGIAAGDLPGDTPPELVASATWAMSVGASSLRESALIFRGLEGADFGRMRRRMFEVLLDGFGWRPLSTEHDYEAVRRRAMEEVFPEEARKLGLLPKAETSAAGG